MSNFMLPFRRLYWKENTNKFADVSVFDCPEHIIGELIIYFWNPFLKYDNFKKKSLFYLLLTK